jgi:hypothetical protein
MDFGLILGTAFIELKLINILPFSTTGARGSEVG